VANIISLCHSLQPWWTNLSTQQKWPKGH